MKSINILIKRRNPADCDRDFRRNYFANTSDYDSLMFLNEAYISIWKTCKPLWYQTRDVIFSFKGVKIPLQLWSNCNTMITYKSYIKE